MNERILVTGASRGIGRAVALSLAQDGYDIIVGYGSRLNDAQACVHDIEEAGGRGRVLQLDISDRQGCLHALSEDIDAHGAYYGVVLNAGISDDQAFPAMPEQAWDNVLRTNLDGFYNVLQPCVMPMVRRRKPGRIVVMTSISGIIGNRGQTNYGAAKAGLIGAAKSLAVELAKRQITVNCVAPGLIDTDMAQGAPVDTIRGMIPLRRLGRPEEVAHLVRYLCSPLAGYVTRQVIRIDGGMAG
jgi:3-oxoacyl-[acyl-carrier protein] reductase